MTTLCISPINSLKTPNKPGISTINNDDRPFGLINFIRRSPHSNFGSLNVKAVDSRQTTKTSSIVCEKCDGNGAVLCTQCKGTGVNAIDHFNGQFKAGFVCWLCRGKREILCGNCNGAGFKGGFMSTQDD